MNLAFLHNKQRLFPIAFIWWWKQESVSLKLEWSSEGKAWRRSFHAVGLFYSLWCWRQWMFQKNDEVRRSPRHFWAKCATQCHKNYIHGFFSKTTTPSTHPTKEQLKRKKLDCFNPLRSDAQCVITCPTGFTWFNLSAMDLNLKLIESWILP